MSENSERVKDQVRDSVEGAFDQLHRAADVITAPVAPIDGVLHGMGRGIVNCITDNHPRNEREDPKNKPCEPDGSATPTPASQNFQNNKGFQGNNNKIDNNKVEIK